MFLSLLTNECHFNNLELSDALSIQVELSINNYVLFSFQQQNQFLEFKKYEENFNKSEIEDIDVDIPSEFYLYNDPKYDMPILTYSSNAIIIEKIIKSKKIEINKNIKIYYEYISNTDHSLVQSNIKTDTFLKHKFISEVAENQSFKYILDALYIDEPFYENIKTENGIVLEPEYIETKTNLQTSPNIPLNLFQRYFDLLLSRLRDSNKNMILSHNYLKAISYNVSSIIYSDDLSGLFQLQNLNTKTFTVCNKHKIPIVFSETLSEIKSLQEKLMYIITIFINNYFKVEMDFMDSFKSFFSDNLPEIQALEKPLYKSSSEFPSFRNNRNTSFYERRSAAEEDEVKEKLTNYLQILVDTFEAEVTYITSKIRLCSRYYEIFLNVVDLEERQEIRKIIYQIIYKRPNYNLFSEYITEVYSLEISNNEKLYQILKDLYTKIVLENKTFNQGKYTKYYSLYSIKEIDKNINKTVYIPNAIPINYNDINPNLTFLIELHKNIFDIHDQLSLFHQIQKPENSLRLFYSILLQIEDMTESKEYKIHDMVKKLILKDRH